MKIQVSYELDLDVRYELASKEPVLPKKGEQYISSDGQILTAGSDFTSCRFFLVRERWHWPSFIKARYLKRADEDGFCYASNQMKCGSLIDWSFLNPNHLDFTPPNDDEIHENPNWKP